MLLKKHYDAAPPPGFLDGFWPQVEQRIEEEAGGGGGGDQEIVFKASPALKMLNIPDRKAPEPEQPAAEAAAPVAPPPQQQTSYRWPVAFVLAVGLATAGILIHKKMNPPVQLPLDRASAISAPSTATAATEPTAAASQPAATGDAMVVASAAGSESATAGSGEEAVDEPEGKAGGASKNHRKHAPRHARRRAKGAATAKPGAAQPEEKPAAGEVKEPAAPKARSGKRTDLDSLIDDAIGKKPAAAAPAKPSPTAAPQSDLPDQLTMNQIRAGMRKVTNMVQACYDKYQIEGKATVSLTITPAGAVSAAAVKGKFFGTDTGTCVVTAVKKASFPKFSGKEMKITYPFILQ